MVISVSGVDILGSRWVFGFVNIHVSFSVPFGTMKNWSMFYLAWDVAFHVMGN